MGRVCGSAGDTACECCLPSMRLPHHFDGPVRHVYWISSCRQLQLAGDGAVACFLGSICGVRMDGEEGKWDTGWP